LSYRGKRKGSYENQRRHSQAFFGNRKSSRSFEQPFSLTNPADAMSHLGTTPTEETLQQKGSELWLKILRSLDFNGAISKLPTEPSILPRQARELVRIASKKKCELQLRTPGSKEPARCYKVLPTKEAENLDPENAGPVDAQVAGLKQELEALGWTLILAKAGV